MLLLESVGAELEGAEAVVVGRSNLFGKPMAQLLLAANATVTMCHSRTRDLAAVCARADILIAAVGRAADGQGRLGQAGRGRDRRRHQPPRERARRRRRLRRGRASARARSRRSPAASAR